MALELKKAQRKKAKLKLGIAAPSGGGKTAGALLIAYGMMKEKYPTLNDVDLWDKIVIIDSENGSGELYVDKEIGSTKIGEYCAITLQPPFEANKYTDAILLAYEAGKEVAIIDSTTHLWAGQGGLLEQQGNAAKRTGNGYTAWRDVTPQLNRFIDTMLQTDIHIIATMRSKQEYIQEKDPSTGKTTIRKVGLNPVQREGMEYEFTSFFEIDNEHNAYGSKDRTSIFDQKTFVITPNVGKQLMQYLESGSDAKQVILATQEDPNEKLKLLQEKVIEIAKSLGGSSNADVMNIVKKYESSGNPKKISNVSVLNDLLNELNTITQ